MRGGLAELQMEANRVTDEVIHTVKILKFGTPETFAVITLKFELGGFTVE